MALTFEHATQPPLGVSRHGVGLTLTPAIDPVRQAPSTDPVEIQRAPDSAGAPDTGAAITIASEVFVPAAGVMFFDPQASTDAIWWYRYRHVSAAGVTGAWSGWFPAHTELFAANLGSATGAGDIKALHVAREALAGSAVSELDEIGINIVRNGDVEDGFSFWEAGSTAADRIEIESGGGANVFNGDKSFKITDTNIDFNSFRQVDRSENVPGRGNPLLVRVTPEMLVVVQATGKLSGSGNSGFSFGVSYYDDDRAPIGGVSSTVFWGAADSAFTTKRAVFAPPSNARFANVFIATADSSDSGTGYLDEMYVWLIPPGIATMAWTDIASAGTAANTTEVTLKSFVLPALGNGDQVEIDVRYEVTGAAGTRNFQVELGTTVVVDHSTAGAGHGFARLRMTRVSGSVTDVSSVGLRAGGTALLESTRPSVDLSAATVNIRGHTTDAADEVTVHSFHVRITKKAGG